MKTNSIQETIKIFNTLKDMAPRIARLLQDNKPEYLSTHNSTGDIQLLLDVQADRLIEESLLSLDCVAGVCSEEKKEIIFKDKSRDFDVLGSHSKGVEGFLIAYDPLDGSSLVDSNLTIGSIFGIYKDRFSPKNLLASSYILYGPKLEIVFANQQEIFYQKLLSDGNWENLPLKPLKESGKINATGGTQKFWSQKHKDFINSLFQEGYRLRYSGGMVPDLHQILIKGGGVFSYPATEDAPNGKLRCLFEVFPLAFIYEHCGGMASDGGKRVLDLEVSNIHQTTPCFLGSKQEILKLLQGYK